MSAFLIADVHPADMDAYRDSGYLKPYQRSQRSLAASTVPAAGNSKKWRAAGNLVDW